MALSIVVAVAVFGLCWLYSGESLASKATGCGISLIASLLGAIPLALGKAVDAQSKMQLSFVSTALRLGLVVLLGVTATLSGRFDRTPLLLSLAASYLALVAVDTGYALRLFRNAEETKE